MSEIWANLGMGKQESDQQRICEVRSSERVLGRGDSRNGCIPNLN
jgi:hypothetical protein